MSAVPVPNSGLPKAAAALRDLGRFQDIPVVRQAGLFLLVAATIALGLWLFFWTQKPDYVMVSAGLDAKSTSQAADTLRTAQIPVRLDAATGAPAPDVPGAQAGEQPFWSAETVLDGFGRAAPPADDLPPVAAADMGAGPAPGVPAGVYVAGEQRFALNAGGPLAPAAWPGAVVEQPGRPRGTELRGWLLAADAVASAMIAGGRRGRGVVAA